jgi:hypothetical protein
MGSVKPALTHFFPGISTPHHQHKHWDAVFNEAPHSILPRINIARIAQRGVFTQPGSKPETLLTAAFARLRTCLPYWLGPLSADFVAKV